MHAALAAKLACLSGSCGGGARWPPPAACCGTWQGCVCHMGPSAHLPPPPTWQTAASRQRTHGRGPRRRSRPGRCDAAPQRCLNGRHREKKCVAQKVPRVVGGKQERATQLAANTRAEKRCWVIFQKDRPALTGEVLGSLGRGTEVQHQHLFPNARRRCLLEAAGHALGIEALRFLWAPASPTSPLQQIAGLRRRSGRHVRACDASWKGGRGEVCRRV